MVTDDLKNDMKAAMKAGEKDKLSVIRMLMAELKNARIAAGEDLDEASEQKVLASYAKKRKEAIAAAREAGRDEFARKEEFEYKTTMAYLPEQMGPEELRAVVQKHVASADAEGKQAFGVVMQAVMAEVGSQADGKAVSALVREMLG
jgi:uncharacterized protein YqeY